MKLIFTDHLKQRLKQREIPIRIVSEIFKNGEGYYWDNLRNRHIVIAEVFYKVKLRKVLAAYDKIGEKAEVITVHPISTEQIDQRLKTGRWTNEKIKN